MLSVLKTDQDLGRLEKSGRLLRRGFNGDLHQVAAMDVGEKLRLATPQDAAALHPTIAAAWAAIDGVLDARLDQYQLVGSAPFWFLDCEDWPGSAFLVAPSFCDWAQSLLGGDRPLMAACFSAEQLLIGYADSAEFHDRLGHVRAAPMARPLAPYPFLIAQDGLVSIRHIQLHMGQHVTLQPQDESKEPLDFALG